MEDRLQDATTARDDRTGRQYAVVLTKGASTWSARVPDLPGCAAVCRTRLEVEHIIGRTIASHLAALERQGRTVPEPRSVVVMVATD